MKSRTLVLLSWGIFFILSILAVMIGRYPHLGILSMEQIVGDPMAERIVIHLRIPRIIGAFCLGSSLATAGIVFQSILGNPLVEPGFLGVSQGAAFGAALVIVGGFGSFLALPLSAGIFALLGLVFSWYLAKKIRFGGWLIRLILAGIIVSAFFSSGLGILKYMADPQNELQELTFWLLGGLSGTSWKVLKLMVPFSLIPVVLLYGFRWRLNLLTLDDRGSHSLGLSPEIEKKIFLVLGVIATASVVAYCGIVSWVGLIVPHIARRLGGADTAKSLAIGIPIGASFVLFCDTLARCVSVGEIPLGILCSLIGAGLFAFLMVLNPVKEHL